MSCSTKPPLPTVEMIRAASAGQIIDPSGGNDYFYQEKNFPLILKAQLELVTQAIICNAAQVIALMPMYATCDFDFGFAGVPGSHHNGLSHTGPQWAPGAQYNSPITIDNYVASARTPFANAQRWFCKQLVDNVVSVLASTDDPSAPGTKVLDNTLIYWMSEIGDGQNHTRVSEIEFPQVPTHLPLVTIGKCAGAIKSGQVVQFPDRGFRNGGGDARSPRHRPLPHSGQGHGSKRRHLPWNHGPHYGDTGVRRSGIALAAVIALGAGQACVSDPGGNGSGGNPGNAGTTGAGGTGGGTGGTVGFVLDCPQPNMGSPTLRLFTRAEMENTLSDVFPEVKGQWTGSLPANQLSLYGFDNDGSVTVGTQLAGALVDTALSVATAVTGSALATLLPCSVNSPDRSCADQFLMKYGRRLFRRPLTQAEHDRYLAFFDASVAKSDFKTALKWMAVGLIQSPNAVYRSEVGVAKPDGTRALTPYEVATALAYTYTGSTPSEALLTKADSGNLGDVLALARGLVATEPGKQALQRFFEGYLGYTGVSSVQRPNITAFGNVSAADDRRDAGLYRRRRPATRRRIETTSDRADHESLAGAGRVLRIPRARERLRLP